jgi:hypothetical protein
MARGITLVESFNKTGISPDLLSLPKTRRVYFSKHVSETGFYLRLQVKPTPETGNRSIDWAQLSRFYLKTETESSLRNVGFEK